jgi:hypothetical protein
MKNTIWLYSIVFACLLILPIVHADCSVYSYTNYTDGSTDYFGINTVTDNTTAFGTDNLWLAFTFFTPRANFTSPVNQTITAGANGSTSTLSWVTPINFSTSLVLKNGTDIINSTNYTLVISGTNRWLIKWNDNQYNNSIISVFFNRTFVKNVDDIVLNASGIYSSITTAYFLTQNTPTAFGDTKTFRFNSALLGNFINNTNWAVGWSYTTRTCVATQVDSGAYTGILSTKTTLFAAFGLLAVLLLAMAAFAVVQIFNGGGGDLTVISITIIGGGILLIIAFVVIYYVAKALVGI